MHFKINIIYYIIIIITSEHKPCRPWILRRGTHLISLLLLWFQASQALPCRVRLSRVKTHSQVSPVSYFWFVVGFQKWKNIPSFNVVVIVLWFQAKSRPSQALKRGSAATSAVYIIFVNNTHTCMHAGRHVCMHRCIMESIASFYESGDSWDVFCHVGCEIRIFSCYVFESFLREK